MIRRKVQAAAANPSGSRPIREPRRPRGDGRHWPSFSIFIAPMLN